VAALACSNGFVAFFTAAFFAGLFNPPLLVPSSLPPFSPPNVSSTLRRLLPYRLC
jgi:hypothetical protein